MNDPGPPDDTAFVLGLDARALLARRGTSAGEAAGDRIGHYVLLQQIGEGGFGTVWMAEQEQPVQRRVALKIIKPGMDSLEVVARFEQERQALALMDHPNIAKVFDAGTTPQGRPYFVMELVRGIPITGYCDEQKLPAAERLDLFIAVCQAVQHAHQKGIIHRDLKPSNILVTLDQNTPVPKVIDFGVAKAMQPHMTDLTVFTRFDQAIGTPLYMSPEQAGASGLDIDTRSDIYSLGVLLYEMLTGRTPFEATELLRHGLDEIRRILREEEPPRPSTALGAMDAAKRTTIARRRQLDPSKLASLLRGDLDWIVMKAMEKDRTRRYESASALAADIQRFLDDEAVLATPPGAVYRFRKFARRHKAGLSAAALITIVLLAATVVSVWQARQAVAARKEAEQREAGERAAKEDAEAIAEFVTGVFQSPDPARDGRKVTVAEKLDRAVKELDRVRSLPPERRAALQATLGRTYHALDMQREATALFEKARDFWQAKHGSEHIETILVLSDLARSWHESGRRAEALRLQQEILDVMRRIAGPKHPRTILAMSNLAISLHDAGRLAEALQLREEAFALSLEVNGREEPGTLIAMGNLAISYSDAGRKEEARKLEEELLELRRRIWGPDHAYTLLAESNLASAYSQAGREEEALPMKERVLARCREVFDDSHPETIAAMSSLASSYASAGRDKEALTLREEVLRLRRIVPGPDHPDTISAMLKLALSYEDDERHELALALREEALTLSRKVNGKEHPDTIFALNAMARSCRKSPERQSEAIDLLEEALRLAHQHYGPDHPDTLISMRDLAFALRDAKRESESLKLMEELVPLSRKGLGPEHPETLGAMSNLAVMYDRAGRAEEAIKLQIEALEIKRRALPPQHPYLATALSNLAFFYYKAGRMEEAEALKKEFHANKTRAGAETKQNKDHKENKPGP